MSRMGTVLFSLKTHFAKESNKKSAVPIYDVIK